MDFNTIHAREITMICQKRRALIVDIRETKEYQKYHLKGARNVPYSEDPCWIYHFSKRRALILYCEYGSTSLLAARRLGREGFEVYTVIGGIRAIQKENGGTIFYN